MKHLSSVVLPSILSLTLTLSPVWAQSSSAPKNDEVKASVDPADTPTSSPQQMDEKNSENGAQVLSAVPSTDTSNPPGRTSRALIIGLIIGGAAAVVALILAFHGGDKTPKTILTPGTPTVNPPSQ